MKRAILAILFVLLNCVSDLNAASLKSPNQTDHSFTTDMRLYRPTYPTGANGNDIVMKMCSQLLLRSCQVEFLDVLLNVRIQPFADKIRHLMNLMIIPSTKVSPFLQDTCLEMLEYISMPIRRSSRPKTENPLIFLPAQFVSELSSTHDSIIRNKTCSKYVLEALKILPTEYYNFIRYHPHAKPQSVCISSDITIDFLFYQTSLDEIISQKQAHVPCSLPEIPNTAVFRKQATRRQVVTHTSAALEPPSCKRSREESETSESPSCKRNRKISETSAAASKTPDAQSHEEQPTVASSPTKSVFKKPSLTELSSPQQHHFGKFSPVTRSPSIPEFGTTLKEESK